MLGNNNTAAKRVLIDAPKLVGLYEGGHQTRYFELMGKEPKGSSGGGVYFKAPYGKHIVGYYQAYVDSFFEDGRVIDGSSNLQAFWSLNYGFWFIDNAVSGRDKPAKSWRGDNGETDGKLDTIINPVPGIALSIDKLLVRS